MFSFILGFIIGCVAAVFLTMLVAPFIWRRALFLARKIVRSELPLSLKEVEADRDFLRARQAADICRLQEELIKERQDNHSRKLALSRGREQLSRHSKLQADYEAQQLLLASQEKKIAALEEKNRELREKARAGLKLKTADLAEFRRQIKQIAAQTAGFIAAAEGAQSPILQLAGAEAAANGGKSKNKRGEESLAAAIIREAEAAGKAQKAQQKAEKAQ